MTLARKVREAYLADQVEKTLSKRQILENYLNTVYFGEGAYGVEAASQTFFAKSAKNLTLAEGALIAGLAQSPSRLDPYVNPDRSRRAAQRSARAGCSSTTTSRKAQYDQARRRPARAQAAGAAADGIYSRALLRGVREEAAAEAVHRRRRLQRRPHRVHDAGHAPARRTPRQPRTSKFKQDEGPSGRARVDRPAQRIRQGHGRRANYNKSKFNLATQGYRQPGSSFKTFVLVTALEQGMPPWLRSRLASARSPSPRSPSRGPSTTTRAPATG